MNRNIVFSVVLFSCNQSNWAAAVEIFLNFHSRDGAPIQGDENVFEYVFLLGIQLHHQSKSCTSHRPEICSGVYVHADRKTCRRFVKLRTAPHTRPAAASCTHPRT